MTGRVPGDCRQVGYASAGTLASRPPKANRLTGDPAHASAMGGVAVMVEAGDGCMTTRRVSKESGLTATPTQMLGAFRDRAERRQEFLAAAGPAVPFAV